MKNAVLNLADFTHKNQRNFDKKVEVTGLSPGACHIWKAGIIHDGYGEFWAFGSMRRAHRVAFVISGRAIPEGHLIRHICHNPACVNPAHLLTGTDLDNKQDEIKAGRFPSHRGELNSNSKLTLEQVEEIRLRFDAGGISKAKLAREFGVTDVLVGLIVRRKIWID